MEMDKEYRIYLDGGEFEEGYSYSDLADLLTRFSRSQQQTLVVHFHGGLNPRAAGEETATGLTPLYLKRAFPVFFIWQSGVLDALRYWLRDIFKDPFLRKLFALALERVLRDHPRFKEMSTEERYEVALRESANWFEETAGPFVLQAEEPFSGVDLEPLRTSFTRSEEEQFARELTERRDLTPSTISDPAKVSAGWPWWIRLAKVVYQVLKRFRKHRDHGVWCTIYEELLHEFAPGGAAEIWKQMKEACGDAFGRSTDSMGRPRCGGTAFFKELQGHWDAWPQGKPRIVLVGHSCGAVFIDEWLRAADRRLSADITFDVILLASADSFEMFHESAIESKHRIANIRAFAMTDDAEKDDPTMRPAAYSRSLLYLVAGALEGGWGVVRRDQPLVGMERYHSGSAPYDDDEVLESLEFLEDRTVFGPTPNGTSPGWGTDAGAHGEFDDPDSRTVQSVLEILEKGFEPRM